MVEHQGPRRHAACKIIVHGLEDVTDRINPYLISVQVIDSIEGSHSEAHIELDDRNCELSIPPDDVPLTVMLGWAGTGPRLINTGRGMNTIQASGDELFQERPWGGPGLEVVFSGWVDEVESGFGRRGGGRRLWITGKSGNTKGKAKETQMVSEGEGNKEDTEQNSDGQVPLSQVMDKVFAKSGIKVKLSPMMQKLKRNHWGALNESPANFGQRMATELGGVFQISNGIASLVGRGEGVNADGDIMDTIEAVWGVNLVGWRIKPFSGRSQWGSSKSRFFDLDAANWESIEKKIGGANPFGGAKAIANTMSVLAGKPESTQTNDGTKGASEAKRGTGWVLLNGEPRAHAYCNVLIQGARPGVDGTYTVSEAEHNYTRGVGYTTRLNVQNFKPKVGDYNYPNDPGHEVHPKMQSTDPLAPNYVPAPPISGPQTWTEEEKARMRQWYIQNGQTPPEILQSKEEAEALAKMRDERAAKQAEENERLAREMQEMLDQLGGRPADPVFPPISQ